MQEILFSLKQTTSRTPSNSTTLFAPGRYTPSSQPPWTERVLFIIISWRRWSGNDDQCEEISRTTPLLYHFLLNGHHPLYPQSTTPRSPSTVGSASRPPTESIKRKWTEVNPWRPQFRSQYHPLIGYRRCPGFNLVLDAGQRYAVERSYEDFRPQCGLDCRSTGCCDGRFRC